MTLVLLLESVNNIEIFNEEVKSSANLVATVMKCENIYNVVDVKKFSGFKKLLTVTVCCLRFMDNMKNCVFKKHVNK